MPIKNVLPIPLVLALAACTGLTGSSPSAEPSQPEAPTGTASPSPTPDETATSTASPTTGDTAPPDQELATCENPDGGYTVSYPAEWWANERVEAEDPVTDIPACAYFAPQPVELEPGTDDLSGVAVRIEVREGNTAPSGEVISSADVTVDGRDAVAREVEVPPQPGFVPEDSVAYEYVVELEGDRSLVAAADNIQVDDATYQDARPVLDRMMGTMEIED